VTAAPLLAAAGAAAALVAAWNAVGAVEGGLGRVLEALGPDGAVARVLAPLRAGRGASRDERRRLGAVAGLALLCAGTLVGGPLAGAVLAAGAPLLASSVLAGARARRRARLARAAPAVARAVADALAGGHSVRGALAVAGEGGLSGPAREELRAVAAALALGEPTEPVLERLRERAAHPAYDALVAAVLLQRDSGGDLAGLLRRLARTLEEQVRVEADARAMTAQARFTAMLVAALPALAAGVAELARPGYVRALLARPSTGWLVAVSIVLQVLAWLAVRRIARVRG
jgi:tight adherence protein B